MAKEVNPQSYNQILGQILRTYRSKIGVDDNNPGAVNLAFFEAFAQLIYRSSGSIFGVLRDKSVDRASGEKLRKIAEEEDIVLPKASTATGTVTITDTSFNKISTKIYSGSAPPNIGSSVIRVSDASEFPSTGAIYIGRGTDNNAEGPINYSAVAQVGSFYEITLDTVTTKFHNINESVILAQGGVRNINVGTVVQTAASGATPAISYTTTRLATILDGETTVSQIPVAAAEIGIRSNVVKNTITKFITDPFTGASVTNPSPITNGRGDATDDEIRIAIKKGRISKSLGTENAINDILRAAQVSDENVTITSSQLFNDGTETSLIIDNGEGLESKTAGVGLESIVDSALGGEREFQLAMGGQQSQVEKAFLESTNTSPFGIYPNDRLAILVGGILSEHVFLDGDFRTDGFATAFEVEASINANSDLAFEARTIDNGTKITITAKEESNEFIQKTDPTTGTDAGIALGLSDLEVETLKVYKNNKPLSRNGRSAIIESENQSDWANTIADGETLIVSVDGTGEITYTFTDADFAAEGTHSTVNKNNTLQSWVNVINAKITGITASINGNRLVLTSNLGASSRAAILINQASTLVTEGVFTTANGLSSTGVESDFRLSRSTGQFKLTYPLDAGDKLTIGSDFTQGAIESGTILGGNVTLAGDGNLWIVIDDTSAATLKHGVAVDSQIFITKQAGDIYRFRSVLANAFANIQEGDYVIIWSEDLLPGNRIEGKVSSVGTDTNPNDYFEVRLTSAEYAAASAEGPVVFSEGLAFVRSETIPQKIRIAAGAYNINTISDDITDQLIGGYSTTANDENIIIATNDKGTNGAVLLVTADESAKVLNFTLGDSDSSTFSHFGFSQSKFDRLPAFIHSTMVSDRYADTPVAQIPDFETSVDLATLGVDPNLFICMQEPYLFGGNYIKDAQAADECVQIDDITGTTVDIDINNIIRRVRANDRFYLLNTLDFHSNDDLTVIFDSDTGNKTFPISIYRDAQTNTSAPINSDEFRAYDINGGPTTEFDEFFGNEYNFKNYKLLMKARNVIDPSGAINEDAILFRSAEWGSAGNLYNVGYAYPTSANQPIGSAVTVEEDTKIKILLKSGAPIANNIDGTTEWDITITPDTPVVGVDEVTYTHNGTGTAPAIGALSPGNYVTINSQGEFSKENTGTFRVSAATATSFTVRRPGGAAVAETGIATLTTGTIALYSDSSTTAQEIVDYVTNNLTAWITAEIIDDAGSTGAGVINLSTYEDSSFVSEYVSLVDGINWIKSSDVDAVAPTNQFILKRTLSLPSFSTNTANAYAFNNGEDLKLIPTTIEQLKDFLSVLAVTGATTVSDISVIDRDNETLQISTNILGSSGAVTISGGTANTSQALILSNVTKISGLDLIKASINKSSASGIGAGSYVKLSAAFEQNKITGISFTTQVTTTPNFPTPTTSTIELTNRDVSDLYFGQPRNHFRTRGRAFHVEKHGSLTCISWDETTGGDPVFTKSVEFDDAGGGNMSVAFNSDFLTTEYTADSGNRNFNEVQVGDFATIAGFSNSENNGIFEVKGISDDGLTLSVDNPNGVSEASVAIAASNITIATEIKEGDTVEIGVPFGSLNQGTFRVIRRYENSIYIENPSSTEERVVITDNLRSLGFDATTQFNVTVPGNMRIEWNTNGTEPTLENAKLGDELTLGSAFASNNQGTFMVVDSGDNYIEVANSKAISQSNVTVTGIGANILESHTPSMVFSPYENTRAGDVFTLSGNVLGSANQGSYTVTDVISKSKIVVSGILSAVASQQLNDLFVQVSVREGTPYTGYKKVLGKAVNPANMNQTCLVFDTSAQFQKITEAGSVVVTAQNKLAFDEKTIVGIDAYKYNIGAIRHANKLLYGDPRDTITFKGVAAFGAEIPIKAPLKKRIKISINVRVQTGIPFVRIIEQVRNNISALINSSPIGESIAISDIIASVNSIPGTRAISISSPAYSPSNDVIVVNQSEKPLILDIVNDIIVSKVE